MQITKTSCLSNLTISQVEPIVNDVSMHKILSTAEEKILNSREIRKNLANYYYSVGKVNTAIAVENCGTFLMFKKYSDLQHTTKLDKANFCKNALCPLCSWRRALKYSYITDKAIKTTKKYLYHLVLAVPNTLAIDKGVLMNLKSKAVYFLKNYLKISSYISNLEITKSDKGFHPHLHIVFESDDFIKVDSAYVRLMSSCWKRCVNKFDDEYEGYTFYLQGVKKDDDGLCRELTKYAFKSDVKVTDADLSLLASSLHGVRRMSSGGNFKKALSAAKRMHSAEIDEEITKLSKYDYEYLIFNYINGVFVEH